MTQPLALEGQHLALELYALLRDLDPAAWRDDLEQVVRRRLDEISARLDELVAEMPSADAHIAKLRALLAQLSALIDEYTPNPDLTAAELARPVAGPYAPGSSPATKSSPPPCVSTRSTSPA
jgi:hypothetical protein